jgi:protein-disulfide isomerase
MPAILKVPVSADDHIQGNEGASITLVEYGDYQCPACGYAYPIVKQLQKHFGSDLRLVFRNFPLNEAHPFAEVAAETAEFANDYDRFWEMHDLLYENQLQLSHIMLVELADSLQLPTAELETALKEGKYRGKIKADFTSGVRSGVNGTPTFYVNGLRYDGSFEYEDFVIALQSLR